MRNVPSLTFVVIGLSALAACGRDESDQNITITNNTVGADIEALPPDESSAPPTDELANGAADGNEASENLTNSY